MSHVLDHTTYQILQNVSESFIEFLKIFLEPCAHLRLVYNLNTETRQNNNHKHTTSSHTNKQSSNTNREHFHTLLTHHLNVPHQTNRIISLATMHYAVPIAILASLATVGLAAPQNDAGDSSRCGISLFIGGGSPQCNINTSNQPGGHGQSSDLSINGDCVPPAGGYFGAIVHPLFLHSPCLLSLRVDMLILGVSPRTILSAP